MRANFVCGSIVVSGLFGLILVLSRLYASQGQPAEFQKNEAPDDQAPDVKAQIKSLEEQLQLIQAASDEPESTKGPFGVITRVGPCDKDVPKGVTLPIVSSAFVGLSPAAPGRCRFDLLVLVSDETGNSVASGFSSITLSPGFSQDMTLVLLHSNPRPGKYEIHTSMKRSSKPPSKPGDVPWAKIGESKSCSYTVK